MHFTGTKSSSVEAYALVISHGGILNIAMYHHRETFKSNLKHYDETKKMLTTQRQSELKKTSS